MESKNLFEDYQKLFRLELEQKSHASFLEGELAVLRIKCLLRGVSEKRMLEMEEREVDAYYQKRKKSSTMLQPLYSF